jgi:hypothetical protein
MAKSIISCSIDTEVIEYHRKKGTPISPTVNEYLKALMGENIEKVDFGKQMSSLEAELAKVKLEKAKHEAAIQVKMKQEQKDEFKADVLALIQLHKEKDEKKSMERVFFKRCAEVCEKHDLQRAELLAYVEGRKILPK